MQTPAGRSPTELLTSLRNGLLIFHKVLLYSERAVYERDIARIESPGQFLSLVMDDPWFAWLRELSMLMVQIDEQLDEEEPPTRAETNLFLDKARAMLVPAEFGKGFAKRYFEALQRDPDVVLAHAETTRLIAALRGA